MLKKSFILAVFEMMVSWCEEECDLSTLLVVDHSSSKIFRVLSEMKECFLFSIFNYAWNELLLFESS
jgi:hypothetical protein